MPHLRVWLPQKRWRLLLHGASLLHPENQEPLHWK
jgi:hypothetical protein